MKEQKMLQIPEYYSLNVATDLGTVWVAVKIDGKSGMLPGIRMDPSVLARLVEAFTVGELGFMSFDEHPKCLTGIAVTQKGKVPSVKLSARSLVEGDGFPADWETADPRVFGAAPWDGMMK